MSKLLVTISDAGPLELVGEFEMLDGAGKPCRARKRVSLCRCGRTARPPYCDFAHQKTGFDDACRASRFTGGGA